MRIGCGWMQDRSGSFSQPGPATQCLCEPLPLQPLSLLEARRFREPVGPLASLLQVLGENFEHWVIYWSEAFLSDEY